MARSTITNRRVDLRSDNGAILQSLIMGEQVRTEVEIKWFTNLRGSTVRAALIEADNSTLSYIDGEPEDYPNEIKTGATARYLSIAYTDTDSELTILEPDANGYIQLNWAESIVSNKFQIIWDDKLAQPFAPQAGPDQPVYGYFGLELRDSGEGELQQVWKPLRGLVEFRYSPNPF